MDMGPYQQIIGGYTKTLRPTSTVLGKPYIDVAHVGSFKIEASFMLHAALSGLQASQGFRGLGYSDKNTCVKCRVRSSSVPTSER